MLTQLALPLLNIRGILRVPGSTSEGPADHEFEDAILITLSSSMGVFVPAQGNCQVLQITGQGEYAVCTGLDSKKAAELEPGDVVIFTTGGAGDGITVLANQLLGEKAYECRRNQSEWKGRLREALESRGYAAVRRELQKFGAKDATEVNLRNWCNGDPRHIAPGSEESFRAILTFVRLDAHADAFLESVMLLRSAHQSAGMRISNQIRQKVVGSSLSTLFRDGIQEFALDELDSDATQTAFLVEERIPEIHLVNSSRLGRVFEITEDSWH